MRGEEAGNESPGASAPKPLAVRNFPRNQQTPKRAICVFSKSGSHDTGSWGEGQA